MGPSGAEQGTEESVEADEVGQALAGGQVVDEAAAPVEVGDVDAGFGGSKGGTEGAEDPVERGRIPSGAGSEAVEHVEGVQLAEAHAGSSFSGEADVGYLCGGEDAMVLEETAQVSVPFGEPSEDGQQPTIEVSPSTTTDGRSG